MTIPTNLRELAQAATPGPWKSQPVRYMKSHVVYVQTKDDGRDHIAETYYGENDAAFIAAASPDVVIGMLDEIERLRSTQVALDDWERRHGKINDVTLERDELRQQLAEMTAARDEACELANDISLAHDNAGRLSRIRQLRAIGSKP